MWRLAPSGFDAHGNPIFTNWTKVLTDPVFAARSAGTADALHGGNELADRFTSDWMGADGSPETGYYVQARGGRNFSANEGPQHKITRYVPDGRGGYVMQWRTGRSALQTSGEARRNVRGDADSAPDQRPAERRRPVALRHPAVYRRRPVRGHALPRRPPLQRAKPPASTRSRASSSPDRSCRTATTAASTWRWENTRRCSSKSRAGRCTRIPCGASRTCNRA